MCLVAVESLTSRWMKGVILSTAAAAAIYLATVLWAGRAEVGAAVRMVNADILIAVLALSTLNYGLRFVRWHYYLRTLGSAIRLRENLRIYLAGFALTTTPGKAGEMARSLWLKPYGVSATSSLAAFLTERLQDFLAMLVLSSIGLSLYHRAKWLLLMSLGLVLVAFIVLYASSVADSALKFLGARSERLVGLAKRVSEILLLMRRCLTPGRFAFGFSIGLLAWGAESLSFFLLMQALGSPLKPAAAVFIYAFSMLAGAVSFLPGGLGGSEASMILLLRLSNVPLPLAVSATLLIRLATLWYAVAIGIVALLVGTRLPSKASAVPTQPDIV
jgi:uncharacterized protein (TIRG00374 family)